MKSIKELHNKSMELAEQGFLAKISGDIENSINFFKDSLTFEIQAIKLFDETQIVEPTYSILHQSAARLALDCQEPRLAEQLVTKALSQNPPEEIAEELRDLLEQINLQRHLKLRGISLNSDELQMNLTGDSVGFGFVPSEELLNRVENASKMLYRIVERKGKQPFREKGRIKKKLKDNYEIFVSVPRAASFSVTLKVGIPSDQNTLPGFNDTSEVIDEFMDLVSCINDSKLDEVKKKIDDPVYYRNFLALAKSIAPDGKNIKQVGFTSQRDGQEQYTSLTTPKSSIETDSESEIKDKKITIKGYLRFADDTHGGSGVIKIIDEKDKSHKVNVPKGMMNDIVRPMWDSKVKISGFKSKEKINLVDITEIE